MPHVAKVEVDLERDLFTITPSSAELKQAALIETVKAVGFEATVLSKVAAPKAPDDASTAPREAIPAFVQAALDQARREKKLVLLDFFAEWCGPCKLMLNTTFKAPAVIAELAHYVVLTVDTDVHPEIASYFAVTGIPDIRLLKADGGEAARIIGFRDAAAMEKLLRETRESNADVD